MRGPFTDKLPESFAFIEAGGYQIYVYDDGQMALLQGEKKLFDLEILDCESVQDLEAQFFAKLTEIFGSMKRL